jgi:REP element-mobilizing transposase RayT
MPSSNLRKGRHCIAGHFYMLTSNTLDREPFFRDLRTGRILVQEMRKAQADGMVKSLAWVIMPDHLHWLVQLQAGTLCALMRQVKSRSTRLINRQLNRSGALWQKNFHDRAVRRDEDLKSLARYVLANPLRGGLVKKLGDYPLWDATWL